MVANGAEYHVHPLPHPMRTRFARSPDGHAHLIARRNAPGIVGGMF